MTDLNTLQLKEIITTTFQELLTQPTKSVILLWKNTNPQYPNSFILKQEGKRYLGLVRTDRNGETYWKFRQLGTELATDKIKSETNPENPNSIPVMDNLTKFKQRQAKTEQINHAKSKQAEQSINNSQSN